MALRKWTVLPKTAVVRLRVCRAEEGGLLDCNARWNGRDSGGGVVVGVGVAVRSGIRDSRVQPLSGRRIAVA